MSTLIEATTSDFIYSALSFYARRRQCSLPGTWFVEALAPYGIAAGALRQNLYRMEKAGALLTVRDGRRKRYSPSPTTQALMDAGLSRITRPAEEEWDQQWTLIHFGFTANDRRVRDLVRDVLQAEGFASLGPGLYIHPRDRARRVLDAMRELDLEKNVSAFRGRWIDDRGERDLVARLWDSAATATRYRAFIRRFRGVADQPADRWTDEQAFAIRFAVVFAFLRISWEDPELPPSLLNQDLGGTEARMLAQDLYERLTEAGLRYGDAVLRQVEQA